ncbi:MAG: T9SS type A sorting domain-containing protein, partial [Chitinophagales bacterium]
PPNTYMWSNGMATQTITATAPLNGNTTYTVTVSNNEGCTGTDEVSVSQNALPMPTITSPVSSFEYCFGTGGADLDAGAGFVSYSWSNNATTQTISATAMSGMTMDYFVTVTNAAGCENTASAVVSAHALPMPTITSMGSFQYCDGDGGVDLDAGMFASYMWSNNATTQTINATAALGTPMGYTVTVTDGNGCENTASASVTNNALPMPTITSMGSFEYCDGDGGVDLDAGMFASYVWSNTATTQTINATAMSGMTMGYTVTVTDGNGCSGTAEAIVTNNALPAAMATGDEICIGDGATVTATGGSTYTWSNGDTGATIMVTPTTTMTYTVTVTDGNSCSDTATAEVTVNPLPVVSVTAVGANLFDEFCSGEDGADVPATTSNTESARYRSSINNAAIYNWSVPSAVAFSQHGAFGTSTGTIASGRRTIRVNWPDNTTTMDAFHDVFLTVTDANGCSSASSVQVTIHPLPDSSIESVGTNLFDEFCSGADGVDGTGTNGTTSARYRAVADNGAGDVNEYTWSLPTADAITYHNDTGNNGGVTNRRVVRVNWPDNNTGVDALHGVFLTVTSADGCTSTSSVEVTIHPLPVVQITGTFEYCPGREAFLDAGEYPNTPNTYAWSNTASTQTITTTVVGVYTVTVTTDDGCTGTATAEVSATPCLAEAGVLTVNPNICANEDLEVSTNGTENMGATYDHYFFVYTEDNLGNTGFVAKQQAGTATGAGSSDGIFSGLTPGDYLVCAYNECTDCDPNPSPITTDLDDINDTGNVQNGCFDSECQSVTIPEPIAQGSATGQVLEDNAAGNNIYIAEVCGGVQPYEIEFNHTPSTVFASITGPFSSPNSGCVKYRVEYADEANWTLIITDSNNCSPFEAMFTSEGTFGELLPQIDETVTTGETCVAANRKKDGDATFTVSGGDNSCGVYSWSATSTNGYSETGTFTAPATPTPPKTSDLELIELHAGKYHITITDCAGTTTLGTADVMLRTRGRRGCRTTTPKSALEQDLAETVKVYPNPFTTGTTIEFTIYEEAYIDARIITMDGREVAKVYSGTAESDLTYRLPFNSESLPSGVYILEIVTDLGAVHHERLYIAK